MKIKVNRGYLILVRYLILLALVFSLEVIYKIFTPITIYPIIWLLRILFDSVILNGSFILINFEKPIEIISACIGSSAYLLLLILNLSVPMQARKRIYSLIVSILLFLALNVLRIVLFASLYVNSFKYFDFTHKIFWYAFSTLFVVLIWFFVVRFYNVKDIPIYSDLKYLIRKI